MLYGINGTFRSMTLCRSGHERKNIFFLLFIRACACSPDTSHNIMEDSLGARKFLF